MSDVRAGRTIECGVAYSLNDLPGSQHEAARQRFEEPEPEGTHCTPFPPRCITAGERPTVARGYCATVPVCHCAGAWGSVEGNNHREGRLPKAGKGGIIRAEEPKWTNC